MLTRKSINNHRQNKCSYIVNDLARLGIKPEIVHTALLRRGAYKWFSARRDIIRLKEEWKSEVNGSLARQEAYKEDNKENFSFKNKLAIEYERGYRKAMENCRKDVRRVCHQSRWVADERDRGAVAFLTGLESKNANAERR